MIIQTKILYIIINIERNEKKKNATRRKKQQNKNTQSTSEERKRPLIKVKNYTKKNDKKWLRLRRRNAFKYEKYT